MKKTLLSILLLAGISASVEAQIVGQKITNPNETSVEYTITAVNATAVPGPQEKVVVNSMNSSNNTLNMTITTSGSDNKTVNVAIAPSNYNTNSDIKGWIVNNDYSENVYVAEDKQGYSGKTSVDTYKSFIGKVGTGHINVIGDNYDQIITVDEYFESSSTSFIYGDKERIKSNFTKENMKSKYGVYYFYAVASYDDMDEVYNFKYYAIANVSATTSTNYSCNKTINYNVVATLPVVSNSTVTSLIIPDVITSIAPGAITALPNLTSLSAKCVTVESPFVYNSAEKTQLIAAFKTASGSYNLPASVATIADGALTNVSNVTLNSTNASLSYTNLGGTNNKVNKPSASLSQSASADGKGVIVTGVVTSANIGTLSATGKSYVDFTGATVLGNINVTPGTNQIYYFPAENGGTITKNNNVVVNTHCQNLVINDGTELYIPTPFYVKKATMNRNFTEGTYATLILPFGINGDYCSELLSRNTTAVFSRYADDVLTFTKNAVVNANTPIMVKVGHTASAISTNDGYVGEIYINATNPINSSDNGATFTGIYAPKTTWGDYDYFFNASAQLRHGTNAKANKVGPFRAWMQFSGSINSNNVRMEIVDEDGDIISVGDETSISEVDAEIPTKGVEYYSTNGTKLAAPVKGINIIKTTREDGTVSTSKFIVK